MKRSFAWLVAILLGAAAVLAGLSAVLVLVVVLVDWNAFRDELETLAGAYLGREVRFARLERDIGWTTHVRLHNLSIGNPEWAGEEPMLRLGWALVSVRLLPLLRGDLQLARIRLEQPALALVKNRDGRANWHFDALVDRTRTPGADAFPVIGRLAVLDGKFGYRDPRRNLDLSVTVTAASGQAGADDPVQLVIEGALQDRPLSLELNGGPVRSLRESGSPYPVSLQVRFGETEVAASGTTLDPMRLESVELDLQLQGPTLADLFPLLGVPLPNTPRYNLAGELGYRDGAWIVRDFAGQVGDSDLRGELSLDTTRRPPFLAGEVVSDRLVFDDLAGLIGALPAPQESVAAQETRLFPDRRWRSQRVHAMDMDLTIEGRQVVSPVLPIDRLSLRLRLRDGRVLARPLSLSLAGGRVTGEAAFNSRDSPPSADAALEFSGIGLQPFFGASAFAREMGGSFSGHAYLLGVGRSLAEVLASARGQAVMAMRDGSLSGLLVEAAGADVTEALGLVVAGDVRVPIRCARADVDVDQGVAEVSDLLIDTPDALLVGKGFVDLDREYFEIQVEARAKDFSLIDVNAPVRFWGPLKNPEYAIGGVDPFPFLEFGGQGDVDCDRLVAEVLRRGQLPASDPTGPD